LSTKDELAYIQDSVDPDRTDCVDWNDYIEIYSEVEIAECFKKL